MLVLVQVELSGGCVHRGYLHKQGEGSRHLAGFKRRWFVLATADTDGAAMAAQGEQDAGPSEAVLLYYSDPHATLPTGVVRLHPGTYSVHEPKAQRK